MARPLRALLCCAAGHVPDRYSARAGRGSEQERLDRLELTWFMLTRTTSLPAGGDFAITDGRSVAQHVVAAAVECHDREHGGRGQGRVELIGHDGFGT
jgi:hypothetical protein